jgi:hypothetical protein
LESLLSSIPDPFESWGPQREEGQLFSVLSPYALDDRIRIFSAIDPLCIVVSG